VGLIAVKSTIITALGPLFGLTLNESVRTGFMLSQGGEFAFVLLSLANQLKLLPEDLNQVGRRCRCRCHCCADRWQAAAGGSAARCMVARRSFPAGLQMLAVCCSCLAR
jgi:Kef-type K+ transport system membrane component KefB